MRRDRARPAPRASAFLRTSSRPRRICISMTCSQGANSRCASWLAWNADCKSPASRSLVSRRSLTRFSSSVEIGSQGGDQQLNRNCGLTGGAAAFYIDQPDDEAIDFRPHPIRDFVTVFRRRRGQERRSRRDEPIGRARDLHRADDLRHTGIDQLESIADLTKRIDARGGGQHCEGADPEEREQAAARGLRDSIACELQCGSAVSNPVTIRCARQFVRTFQSSMSFDRLLQ